jgi:hypothetical protein
VTVPAGLQDLSQSIFAALGGTGLTNSLNLPQSERICLLLVDGLGNDVVEKYGAQFPALATLNRTAVLNSTFPSTTATALATLGTGVMPGVHGMLGYTIRVPRSGEPGRLLNALKWDERVDPVMWQSQPTLYERAINDGIKSSYIAAKRYEGTGFSRATLRGSEYLGANHSDDMVAYAKSALAAPRSFAYLYVNNLDHAGHNDGVGSAKFLDALSFVNDLVLQLTQALPSGTYFALSSDHGMVNVEEKLVLGKDNSLMEQVTLLGGEPRARHIYVRQGALDDVKSRWNSLLGDRVELYTKENIATLIGADITVDAHERLGDLIAVPKGALILIDPTREPQEGKMVGHHGGTTSIELQIPLLTAQL